MSSPARVPGWMTWLLAVACGVIVANLYLAQPLIAEISAGTGLPLEAAGFIVTLTQIGYGAGLLFIVPLGDLVENRRLVVSALGLTTMALVAAATARSAGRFLASALVIGMGSAAAQVLVPFAAHLAPAASRGRVVGNVMSGLLLGIMLARPFASLVAHVWDWHAVFAIAAGAVLVLTMVLARLLPRRQPAVQTRYGVLLRSMWHLVRTTPILRQRALYHAFLFAAFSLFWTTVPLRLASVTFRLTQRGVALFALAGVAGAIAAPIAGRLADRGRTRIATGVAMLAVAVALTAALVVQQGSRLGLAVLVGAAILLDMGVAANNVLGQRAIYALDAESRARLNGLYVAAFFAGGALGSAVGGWAYASGGWSRALWIGLAAPVAGLICFAFERPAPAAATLSRTAP